MLLGFLGGFLSSLLLGLLGGFLSSLLLGFLGGFLSSLLLGLLGGFLSSLLLGLLSSFLSSLLLGLLGSLLLGLLCGFLSGLLLGLLGSYVCCLFGRFGHFVRRRIGGGAGFLASSLPSSFFGRTFRVLRHVVRDDGGGLVGNRVRLMALIFLCHIDFTLAPLSDSNGWLWTMQSQGGCQEGRSRGKTGRSKTGTVGFEALGRRK